MLWDLGCHTYKSVGAFSFPQKATIRMAPTLATPTLSCWPPAASPAVPGAKDRVGCSGRQTPEGHTQSVHGGLCTEGRGGVCIHLGTQSAFREAHSRGQALHLSPRGSSSHALGFR